MSTARRPSSHSNMPPSSFSNTPSDAQLLAWLHLKQNDAGSLEKNRCTGARVGQVLEATRTDELTYNDSASACIKHAVSEE